ncbi:MAG: nuclear transport factor 2 family protein [Actinomycetales bacterium]
MSTPDQTRQVLNDYAEAWRSLDLERILGAYHDDIELHYFGNSPLAGTHAGKEAAFTALAQASTLSTRKLVDIEDILIGTSMGALVVREELGDPARLVRRILLYRVLDGKLRECWLYDEDQAFVDLLWSAQSAS